MKPGGGKAWFTAAELAELALSGLPSTKRKINERATAEAWALRTGAGGAALARPRQARGGGLEYHVDVLPAAARAAIGVAAVANVHVEPTTGAAQLWRWFDGASDKVKTEARRRLDAVQLVTGHAVYSSRLFYLDGFGMTIAARLVDGTHLGDAGHDDVFAAINAALPAF